MKYISPVYENEKVMTSDIICESIYQVAYVEKEIVGEDGSKITVDATQISVNINKLF